MEASGHCASVFIFRWHGLVSTSELRKRQEWKTKSQAESTGNRPRVSRSSASHQSSFTIGIGSLKSVVRSSVLAGSKRGWTKGSFRKMKVVVEVLAFKVMMLNADEAMYGYPSTDRQFSSHYRTQQLRRYHQNLNLYAKIPNAPVCAKTAMVIPTSSNLVQVKRPRFPLPSRPSLPSPKLPRSK